MNAEDALTELLSPGATWRNGSNFWLAMCTLCKKENVESDSDFTRIALKFEQKYLAITGASSMPTKYRSTKSVLRKAIKEGISYIDKSGEIRSKTNVFYDRS